jgi:hypothetical protein
MEAPLPVVEPAQPGPVTLEFTWQGMSALHKGYFADADATTVLAVELGETVGRRTLNLQVGWDSEAHQGSIRLGLVGNELPGLFANNGVQTAALVPLTRALAGYREAVASRFDIRVLSFRIRVGVGDRCEVQVVGIHPRDGTQLSECLAPRK